MLYACHVHGRRIKIPHCRFRRISERYEVVINDAFRDVFRFSTSNWDQSSVTRKSITNQGGRATQYTLLYMCWYIDELYCRIQNQSWHTMVYFKLIYYIYFWSWKKTITICDSFLPFEGRGHEHLFPPSRGIIHLVARGVSIHNNL